MCLRATKIHWFIKRKEHREEEEEVREGGREGGKQQPVEIRQNRLKTRALWVFCVMLVKQKQNRQRILLMRKDGSRERGREGGRMLKEWKNRGERERERHRRRI